MTFLFQDVKPKTFTHLCVGFLTGHVSDLKEVHVSVVALGKAHTVALTNKGHIYTFGINNKGQCGRDFAGQVKEGLS